jgi:phage tail sheath gpL-like
MKCPEHNVEYETVKTTYEQYGVILKDVKALRCPVDGEELFTLEQAEAVRKRITALSPRLKLVRKITRAAGKPSIYLPPEIVKEADLKIGQEVEVYLADKKRIVIEAAK